MTSGLEAGPIPTSKAAVSSRHKSPASATSAQQTAGNPSDKASLNPRKQRQELSTRRMNSATRQTSQSKENTKNAAENPRSPGKTPEMRPKMSSRSPGKHQECCEDVQDPTRQSNHPSSERPGTHSIIQSFVRKRAGPEAKMRRYPNDHPMTSPRFDHRDTANTQKRITAAPDPRPCAWCLQEMAESRSRVWGRAGDPEVKSDRPVVASVPCPS